MVVKRHKVRTFHKLLLIVIISSGSSEALISGSDNHTVFIKNSIRNNCQNCAHCSVLSVLFVATNISLFVLHQFLFSLFTRNNLQHTESDSFLRFSYFGDQYHRNNLINNTVCTYKLEDPDTWLCNIFRLGESGDVIII